MSFRVPRARRSLLAAALLVGVLLSTLSLAGRAEAYDRWPCDPPRWQSYYGIYVQNCTIWKSWAPVRQSADASSPIVGYLQWAGSTNWFTYQCYWGVQWEGQWVTNKWAYTLADNGRWGYVSQVYFMGGDNWEWDGRLKIKNTGWC